VDGSRSSEGATGPLELLGRLHPSQRLAALGAAAIPVSLAFPWYGIPVSNLAQTGAGSFGWAHAALLLTAVAVLVLLLRVARGYELPRPLTVGGLLALAGAWATMLVLYLMLERPDELAGVSEVRLRYGIFVALAGAIGMLAGGRGLRRG
jgi:hypothetical protein